MGAASTIQQLQENQASYDSRFCYVTTLHIDVYSGKVYTIFNFYLKSPFFGKNTKAIVHGSFKFGVPRKETKLNSFLSGRTSICPEYTCQKLLSQCVYLYLKTMDLYMYV